jgi:hypothetical protein
MSERPRTPCPACGQIIEPDDTDVVEAEEVVPMPGMGAPGDEAAGMRVVFHRDCYREDDPSYRRV